MEQYIPMAIEHQTNRTDNFIALVYEYKTLGEKIISDAYGILTDKDDVMNTLDPYNRDAIQHRNEPAQKFINSGIQQINEQHSRLLSACKQFRDVNEMRLQQARELEVAVQTNATEVASVSTSVAQSRARLVKSKGGRRPDNWLKTILEQDGNEDDVSEENEQLHKKRHWSTKWLHRRFWLNLIKKKKPE